MVRVACLWVPDLSVAALLRSEPELAERPLAITRADGDDGALLAVDAQARRAGVRPGMSAVQARSLLPALELRPAAAARVRAAQAALLDVARGFSPRVMRGAPDGDGGEVYLDVAGLERRLARARANGTDPESAAAAGLVRAAAAVGLAARAGVAAGLRVARLAARTAPADTPVQVVAAGRERDFLAPLPVALLPVPARLQAALGRFGIERLGQLAALPAAGLGRRLGPEGLRLWRLARGEDRQPLVAEPEPERFVEQCDPDWPVDRLEPLLALLEPAGQRLAARLACRGLLARALVLELDGVGCGPRTRRVGLAAASRCPTTWRDTLRLELERDPPSAPVEALALAVEVEPERAGQLDFFSRAGLTPSRALDETLARLAALAGPQRVGQPRVVDGHWPDAARSVPLDRAGGASADRAAAAEAAGPPVVPLQVLRPPRPARVVLRGRRPVRVEAGPLGGRVRFAAGPWRLEADWWREAPLARDYYDVALSDGGVYRLFRERDSDRWYIDGICG